MPSYTKLFGSLVRSSVWSGTPKYVKVLWITLLALADKHGEVHSSIPGLMKEAELRQEEVEAALEYFMRPDPMSTTPDEEGRRLKKILDGWFVVTHEKYRRMLSKEDVQERDAARQRRKRAKEREAQDS
jgi:hypothetical protein